MVLPTYNEVENLPALVEETLAAVPGVEIVVVDDASPDGTGEWVRARMRTEPRLHLVAREGKLGLGTAYRAGWRWGLANGFDPIVTMDADFSHHPRYLPALLAIVAGGADLGIGSRYVPGGGIANWPLHRLILSRGANLTARTLLPLPAHDATSGFRAYSARALGVLEMDTIRAEGYSFLEETLWRAGRAGLVCGETPIVFENRRLGKSKIAHAEVYKAIVTLLRLRFSRWRPSKETGRPRSPGAAPR